MTQGLRTRIIKGLYRAALERALWVNEFKDGKFRGTLAELREAGGEANALYPLVFDLEGKDLCGCRVTWVCYSCRGI